MWFLLTKNPPVHKSKVYTHMEMIKNIKYKSNFTYIYGKLNITHILNKDVTIIPYQEKKNVLTVVFLGSIN